MGRLERMDLDEGMHGFLREPLTASAEVKVNESR